MALAAAVLRNATGALAPRHADPLALVTPAPGARQPLRWMFALPKRGMSRAATPASSLEDLVLGIVVNGEAVAYPVNHWPTIT
jgi:hypothetical protein